MDGLSVFELRQFFTPSLHPRYLLKTYTLTFPLTLGVSSWITYRGLSVGRTRSRIRITSHRIANVTN